MKLLARQFAHGLAWLLVRLLPRPFLRLLESEIDRESFRDAVRKITRQWR